MLLVVWFPAWSIFLGQEDPSHPLRQRVILAGVVGGVPALMTGALCSMAVTEPWIAPYLEVPRLLIPLPLAVAGTSAALPLLAGIALTWRKTRSS